MHLPWYYLKDVRGQIIDDVKSSNLANNINAVSPLPSNAAGTNTASDGRQSSQMNVDSINASFLILPVAVSVTRFPDDHIYTQTTVSKQSR